MVFSFLTQGYFKSSAILDNKGFDFFFSKRISYELSWLRSSHGELVINQYKPYKDI